MDGWRPEQSRVAAAQHSTAQRSGAAGWLAGWLASLASTAPCTGWLRLVSLPLSAFSVCLSPASFARVSLKERRIQKGRWADGGRERAIESGR